MILKENSNYSISKNNFDHARYYLSQNICNRAARAYKKILNSYFIYLKKVAFPPGSWKFRILIRDAFVFGKRFEVLDS